MYKLGTAGQAPLSIGKLGSTVDTLISFKPPLFYIDVSAVLPQGSAMSSPAGLLSSGLRDCGRQHSNTVTGYN